MMSICHNGGDAPCIQIRRLISGFDPAVRRERWFAIMSTEAFQAVLDKSGYEADDPRYPDDVFVFAGYIGRIQKDSAQILEAPALATSSRSKAHAAGPLVPPARVHTQDCPASIA